MEEEWVWIQVHRLPAPLRRLEIRPWRQTVVGGVVAMSNAGVLEQRQGTAKWGLSDGRRGTSTSHGEDLELWDLKTEAA